MIKKEQQQQERKEKKLNEDSSFVYSQSLIATLNMYCLIQYREATRTATAIMTMNITSEKGQ